MTHPDLEHAVPFGRGEVVNVFEQACVTACANFCVTKFAMIGVTDLATELLRHGLHAITNTQHRNPCTEDLSGNL